MITLKNETLTITINPHGAELSSVIDNRTGYEFMWQGDPKLWGRRAPVLFPNVGKFKEDTYQHEGKKYELPRHGFARDMTFHVQNVTSNTASFYLKSTPETLNVYPFEFSFQITYILQSNKLTVTYEILNTSTNQTMLYNVGGHPAFNVSQSKERSAKPEYDQISFKFEPSGHYLNIPLTNDGLIDMRKAKYSLVEELPISHRTFKKDALIYQISEQTEVTLLDKAAQVEIRMKPNRMNFFGIWSTYPQRAGFVCLEPWAGITDSMDATGLLNEKYGVISLLPHEINTHDYTVSFSKFDQTLETKEEV